VRRDIQIQIWSNQYLSQEQTGGKSSPPLHYFIPIPTLIIRVGLELTKAYLSKGWKVIAGVRDPKKMPDLEGEIVVVKLDAGEKEDAKKVCLTIYLCTTTFVYSRSTHHHPDLVSVRNETAIS
jgi:hypothetical protein